MLLSVILYNCTQKWLNCTLLHLVKLPSNFLVQLFPNYTQKHVITNTKFKVISIREYSSTLYVGLARAVSPTNTNFRLTFLLTRLQEALYEDLAV